MNQVAVLFSRSPKIGSLLIRLKTHSEWSHCGLLTDKNHVIESTLKKGVAPATLDEFLAHHDHVVAIRISTDFMEEVFNAAFGEIGKPYDWTAILGFLANRDWQEDDAWFCSELVAYALRKAGLFTEELAQYKDKVTPQNLFDILMVVGAIEVIKGTA